MSWSNCGKDSQGRDIGYAHAATCDHPGCDKVIDRGLSYACGGSHGSTEHGCEKYFCEDHRANTVEDYGHYEGICDSCAEALLESGDWVVNEEEGVIERLKYDLQDGGELV